MAVLQCVNRISNYIAITGDNRTDLMDLCVKIEAFSWAYLLSFVPKIRHNARNALSNIIKIYRIASTHHLVELIKKAIKLSWKQKTKYVVLSSVAKEGNCDLIVDSCPKIAKSLLENVEDPTIENLCAELFEILMVRYQFSCYS
jgi:hypothetical protein